MVKGVGGEIQQVTEKLQVVFWINSVQVKHAFHVINGHHSLILGLDFLQSQSAVVDFGENQLQIRGETITLTHPAIRSSLGRTINLVVVPAESEMIIPVKCSKDYCNAHLLLQPTKQSVWFEWGVYALSASKAISRARTYNCITYSVR